MRDRFSPNVFCDFCGRKEDEPGAMFCSPGPTSVHICSDCIVRRSEGSRSEARELEAMTRATMFHLTYLATAARKARDRKLTALANDLFYAANRAFHELDVVLARRGNNVDKETASHG